MFTTYLLILLAGVTGLIYATPGALPPAGNVAVRYLRVLVGSGAMIWALGRVSALNGGADFSDLGYLTTIVGLAGTAAVIHLQSCR